MMQLEVGGRRIPVATGDTVIGSAPWCAIVLEGEGVRPHHAVVQGTSGGPRRSGPPAPTPRCPSTACGWAPIPRRCSMATRSRSSSTRSSRSTRSGRGNTQLFDSGAFADLPPVQRRQAAPRGEGGRVVCLTDGREYSMGSEPLVFGRDAASDVVVTGGDVSRRHAEIQVGAGRLRADGPQRQRHLRQRQAGRPKPSARPGGRHPDRDRRVPVLRRGRAAGPAARTSSAALGGTAAHADRGHRPALRHDARRAARRLRATRYRLPRPSRCRRSRRCWFGAGACAAGGCRSRCRWSTSAGRTTTTS